MIKLRNNKFLIIFLVALICSATIVSCKKDTLEKVSSGELVDLPTEEVKDLKILYTIYGELRNELITKTAKRYQLGKDSSIYIFPDNFYLNSYKDSILESDLVADSASLVMPPYYFTAVGNVVARNVAKGTRIETAGPMYWDSKKKTIETFVFTTIYTTTDTIYAQDGILSDDQFKDILMRKQSGVVVTDFEKTPPDSTNNNNISSDSIPIQTTK